MGDMFAAVVEGSQTALKIFVILKSFNTTNSKKTPPYSAGSFIFVDTFKKAISFASLKTGDIIPHFSGCR
jgi:hypothetical protein